MTTPCDSDQGRYVQDLVERVSNALYYSYSDYNKFKVKSDTSNKDAMREQHQPSKNLAASKCFQSLHV